MTNLYLDRRKSRLGPFTISTVLLCEVVNQGHRFTDETKTIESSALLWKVSRCSTCGATLFQPENKPRTQLIQLV
jgi:hypothetical protein